RYLAAATEHRTFVVDGKSAGFVARTGQSAQSLLDFGFDPSGDWHFVSGIDGKTTIYDLLSLSKVVEHTGQRGWIFDVAISANRKHVLTASSDANVKLWVPQSNKNVTWLRGHRDKVIQTAFVGAGQAVTLSEDGTLRQWNLSRWIEGLSNPDRETRIEGYSGDAVYTPDRSIVALSEAGIFNVESGDEVGIETRPGFDTVFRRFSDDGRWLLADLRSQQTGDTVNACLYDMNSGKIARCILPDDTGRISNTDMDAAAQIITYMQVVGDDYDRHFIVVDARTVEERARRVEPYPNPHQQAAVIGPEGDRLFLQNGSHLIDVFDTRMQPLSSFGPTEDGTKLRFSADRRRVAFIWPAAGALEVWDTQSETRISRIETPFPDSEATVFSPTGTFLTARISATELAAYDVATGVRVAQMQIRGRDFIDKPVFSADESLLTASMEDRIGVLDLTNGRLITEFKMDFRGYAPLTFGKKFTENGDALIAWSWDGPTRFPLMRSAAEVVATAQDRLPRCLGPDQRKRFYLPPEPPRWCITGPGLGGKKPADWSPKYPYGAQKWRDWQTARDAGENPPLPD
ncbi:MAG: WD40 repeat domain-containing protein, partial [Pseudomonadota bacterium]